MTHVAYEDVAITQSDTVCNEELEPITRTDPQAVAVRIFLREDERTALKIACDRTGLTMSHLARSLLIEWLKNNQS